MDDIVSSAELRRQRRLRRLGSISPRCRTCPESDPLCLDRHHIAGRSNHSEMHWECANCHRKLSAAQKDHPQQITSPPAFLEVVAHYLLGLADMLRLIVETLVEFAKRLIEMARQSAAESPT